MKRYVVLLLMIFFVIGCSNPDSNCKRLYDKREKAYYRYLNALAGAKRYPGTVLKAHEEFSKIDNEWCEKCTHTPEYQQELAEQEATKAEEEKKKKEDATRQQERQQAEWDKMFESIVLPEGVDPSSFNYKDRTRELYGITNFYHYSANKIKLYIFLQGFGDKCKDWKVYKYEYLHDVPRARLGDPQITRTLYTNIVTFKVLTSQDRHRTCFFCISPGANSRGHHEALLNYAQEKAGIKPVEIERVLTE
jgi:hypothetical protein